ncbi:hypothetical protein D5086_007243 [Populus alba]|uniref:Uncharacterized protein n=1 Tax=Populus alba TaxID=43335 RepID=A0ACC4CP23_POPAL
MWSCAIFDFYADFGVERGVRLEGLSEAQISKALEELGKAGASLKFDRNYNMALACFLPVEYLALAFFVLVLITSKAFSSVQIGQDLESAKS